MSWKKLLTNKNVAREPPSKVELDNLRSIVARSMKDVAAPGLSADARFVMAYDARTLSLMIVRAAGYRPRAVGGHSSSEPVGPTRAARLVPSYANTKYRRKNSSTAL
jgi:hypothetical protein